MQRVGGKHERGQVAILFALVFTFMFVLFAFVMDFGHLVNTRINLQLAADSAAYAGAAWQANTLNRIGAINYQIRQDIKELAMRIHVTHLRHNRNFPRGDAAVNGASEVPQVQPFICQQAHGYVSLSGRRYDNITNLCRSASPEVGGLPPIIVPPVIAAFDPFARALQAQIRRIADAANDECRAAANDNRILADHLVNTYTRRTRFHADQANVLKDFLNDVKGGRVQANDPHFIRRVAFQSAIKNLSVAATDDFKMEIIPPSGDEYVRLEQFTLNGALFYVNFNVVGDGCVGQPSVKDFTDMVAGITKTPEIVTFFIVKLSAKPRMLFMPQAWVDAAFPEIQAYAAAKPFGGRIGPDRQLDPLLPTANRPGNNNKMVNFSFRPNDQLGMINKKLMALFDQFHPFNGAPAPDGNRDSGWPEPARGGLLRSALQLIHAPTIFDSMFYTVFPNPNRSDDYFEPQYAEAKYPDYLEASDTAGNIISPDMRTQPYFRLTGNKGPGWIKIDARGSATGTPYGSYADETPESHSVTTAIGLGPINEGNAREFGFATKDMVHSGWTPNGGTGRIGYSVKFIGLDALMGKLFVRQSTGGQGAIQNRPNAEQQLTKIYH